MNLLDAYELYDLISRGTENVPSRKGARTLRKVAFNSVSNQGFKKVAFDTRRIDQETQYNPRRGLQNYNRSEAFLSETMSQKIKVFAKLRNALIGLKEKFGKEHEWQDSNARVLLSALDAGLRVTAQDGDFTESQPGVGSFDYLEELLHVRYRLASDQIANMGETELQSAILNKDEELTRKDAFSSIEITKHDVSSNGYDNLLEKLFASCHATVENTDVERTITITVRDKILK